VATVVVIFLTGNPNLIPTRLLRDGMILGAVVGFGFAAFESAGYALIPVPPSRCGTGR
jgi:RsiW-degrading membrane proteinase PrsW (M82 family)